MKLSSVIALRPVCIFITLTIVALILMTINTVISIFTFVSTMVRSARREMSLYAALIKQMEATRQAERKSLNKSLAFASASHDVRAALVGVAGLIDISYGEVLRGSELETNLRQMDKCAKDLLGLLNSILDTSKIEAGKMQLEEEEFNLAELLKDVVDLYHPLAMKKGVDVLLDPCDGSLLKFSHVKGDRGKLKQILCNLLSNAVKFTPSGHICVRGWVKKPSLENSTLASQQSGWLNRFSCLFFKNNEAYNDLESRQSLQQNPNCMEFVFEVDDTGKGIPNEKQKSVFENFVQVKETALGTGGTGLGLGSVRSLVRLMGGDIGIVDKEIVEKGTCFKFNVLFSTCEPNISSRIPQEGYTETAYGGSASEMCNQDPGTSFHPFPISPKAAEGSSHTLLLIQSDERRLIAAKCFESLGIKVSIVRKRENLSSFSKNVKRKMRLSHHSSPGKSGWSSQSDSHSASHVLTGLCP